MNTLKEIIKEHKAFSKQIIKLSRSELITTYKGAALGPAWAVVNPAITIFVYWFAFQIGLRTNGNVRGVPFFLFLAVGMIPWFFMKESITQGANCFRAKKAFVTKMRFPVSTIPTFTMLSKLFVTAILTALIYILVLIMGVKPSIYNLQIFYYMICMFLFFTVLAWTTAPLSVISKDFLNIVRAVITAIFWLSGIVWDPYSLSNPVLRRIVLASPVSYISQGYRNSFLYEKWFFETRFETVMFFAWLAVFFVIGLYTYKKLRKTMPDVL
ncbi:MAG: ABC transporter permease [Christensenellaceae bacterium]|nr:ABC transporter permease [Christensenellaceae bacterium]